MIAVCMIAEYLHLLHAHDERGHGTGHRADDEQAQGAGRVAIRDKVAKIRGGR